MTDRTSASWPVYALGALCAGAIGAAILVVGPASASQTRQSRTVTVGSGVVQSTVSGSGNVQAVSQLNLGFKTGGTVTHIYVSQGAQVVQGQLLATLDPQSAEVTVEQSKATLQSAEANLAKEEESNGETAAGQSSSATGSGSAGAATAPVLDQAASQIAAAATAAPTRTSASAPPNATAPTGTSPAMTSPPSTGPATTTSPSKPATSAPPGNAKATTTPASTSPSKGTKNTSANEGKETSSSSTPAKASISTATREANLASARAAVRSDRLTVQSDEQAVQNTKLYAPEDGTIVSLSGQVGEIVSGSGTTKASSTSSASSGSGSSAAGAGGTSASGSGRSGAGSSTSSSSSSSGSSSSAFAVLSDLSSMQLVVPLSESEIGNVKSGQIATVTVEALEGRKLAAHVGEVATLSTSNSGVVSYDVTFLLDQMESGLKPGMSATAEVVVKQAEGVNVPTSAISGGAVTVIQNGKQVRRRVVAGLAGNNSTIILSGLSAGEKIALPIATSSAGSSSSSRLGGGLGRGSGGFGGGGAGLGGGGGAVFFRGGG